MPTSELPSNVVALRALNNEMALKPDPTTRHFLEIEDLNFQIKDLFECEWWKPMSLALKTRDIVRVVCKNCGLDAAVVVISVSPDSGALVLPWPRLGGRRLPEWIENTDGHGRYRF